jgi:hypothetical protein
MFFQNKTVLEKHSPKNYLETPVWGVSSMV